MYTCKICKKKFKTVKALGGHTSSAHPKNKPEAMPAGDISSPAVVEATGQAVEQTQTPPVQPVTPDDEPKIMDTIREYKGRGLSAKQIKDLGYARTTVDLVFLEDIVPEGKPDEGEHNDEFPVVTNETEPSAIQDNYPPAPEQTHYRLTKKGIEAGDEPWSSPLLYAIS